MSKYLSLDLFDDQSRNRCWGTPQRGQAWGAPKFLVIVIIYRTGRMSDEPSPARPYPSLPAPDKPSGNVIMKMLIVLLCFYLLDPFTSTPLES